MALPSSPPSLPEEPPSSPPLLPTLSSAALNAPQTRKRQLSDYGSLSSDPIFSEDASDSEAKEDDARPRRKRLVKGPWWSVGKRAGQNLRRDMAKRDGYRNADSGVWMGSDDSTDSLVSGQGRMGNLAVYDKQAAATEDRNPGFDAESLAETRIATCLDEGKEVVNLDGLGLTSLSSATLRPLHQLIKQPHFDLTRPPSEDEFSAFTPSIQLFLYGNGLSCLPSELFRLKNVTVLSLRNNELAEVPPQLTQLERLKELNLAGNGIRFLPWELLRMLQTKKDVCKISLRPNPFLAIRMDETLATALGAHLEQGRSSCASAGEAPKNNDQLIFVAASYVNYLGVDGSPVRAAPGSSRKSQDHWHEVCLESQPPPSAGAGLAPPSLFELALRMVQQHCNINEAISWCSIDAPPAIPSVLEEAAEGIEFGNRHCSTCQKQFVIARAEWLEYWFYGSPKDALAEDKLLPFRRQACSWKCAHITPVGTGFA